MSLHLTPTVYSAHSLLIYFHFSSPQWMMGAAGTKSQVKEKEEDNVPGKKDTRVSSDTKCVTITKQSLIIFFSTPISLLTRVYLFNWENLSSCDLAIQVHCNTQHRLAIFSLALFLSPLFTHFYLLSFFVSPLCILLASS